MSENSFKTLAIRLKPGEELVSELNKLIEQHRIAAGVIVSLVGSLREATLRLAGKDTILTVKGPLEIVSCTGTIGNGSMHVHLAVADGTGKTTGGHLVPGSHVYTTIELVILDLSQFWHFERHPDQATGYKELVPVSALTGEKSR